MTDLAYVAPAPWPEMGGGRLAAGILRGEAALSRFRKGAGPGLAVVLLGLPDDTGVALNLGRTGAAAGPTAFRAALTRYGTPYDLLRRGVPGVEVLDMGDVSPVEGGDGQALMGTHERVSQTLAAVHDAGFLPVCVGGGHDLTLPTVRALSRHLGGVALGAINVDAHLDVRHELGSGMPFRALIEDGCMDPGRFTVFGAGRFVHVEEHLRWLEGKGGVIVDVETARRDPGALDAAFDRAFRAPGFVSVDLDALDGAFAPGVSAVNPDGLDVSTVGALVERAGRATAVRHLDFMELSPPHDVDGRTARVAAHLFLRFLAGLAERRS